jgi:hypothetical protein
MTPSVISTFLLLKQPDGHVAISLAVWNGDGSYEDKHPLMAVTTHGINMTGSAFEALGLPIVEGAPTLPYKNLTLHKYYGQNGMTPMSVEDFLADQPAVTASEGFWASLKAYREKLARLAGAKTQGSAVYGTPYRSSHSDEPSRKALKLQRRAEAKAAKLLSRSSNPSEPSVASSRARGGAAALDEQRRHTYESHDVLAAAVSVAATAGTFVSGVGTICKFVDPSTKAKKVHVGVKDLSTAVVKDVARVWITLELEGTTWYVKELEPGAIVQF